MFKLYLPNILQKFLNRSVKSVMRQIPDFQLQSTTLIHEPHGVLILVSEYWYNDHWDAKADCLMRAQSAAMCDKALDGRMC